MNLLSKPFTSLSTLILGQSDSQPEPVRAVSERDELRRQSGRRHRGTAGTAGFDWRLPRQHPLETSRDKLLRYSSDTVYDLELQIMKG
jgi:hypothetical protein